MGDGSGGTGVGPVTPKPLLKRLVWFVVLWGASVLLLWVISLLIKWAIVP